VPYPAPGRPPRDRAVDHPTAELFLSKAQIVQLNRKDVLDLLALLLDHEGGPGDKETINAEYIAALCAKDWGLYTTISMSLQSCARSWKRQHRAGSARSRTIMKRLVTSRSNGQCPQDDAWKMRARVGRGCGGMKR